MISGLSRKTREGCRGLSVHKDATPRCCFNELTRFFKLKTKYCAGQTARKRNAEKLEPISFMYRWFSISGQLPPSVWSAKLQKTKKAFLWLNERDSLEFIRNMHDAECVDNVSALHETQKKRRVMKRCKKNQIADLFLFPPHFVGAGGKNPMKLWYTTDLRCVRTHRPRSSFDTEPIPKWNQIKLIKSTIEHINWIKLVKARNLFEFRAAQHNFLTFSSQSFDHVAIDYRGMTAQSRTEEPNNWPRAWWSRKKLLQIEIKTKTIPSGLSGSD